MEGLGYRTTQGSSSSPVSWASQSPGLTQMDTRPAVVRGGQAAHHVEWGSQVKVTVLAMVCDHNGTFFS